MPAPVVIDFRAGGIADVGRAFRTVKSGLDQIARQEARAAAQTVRANQQAQRQKERAATQALRTFERLQREETRASEKTEKEKVRAAAQASKEGIRLAEKAATEKSRAADRAARAEIRAARDSAREQQKLSNEVRRAKDRDFKQLERDLEKRKKKEKRDAEKEGRAVTEKRMKYAGAVGRGASTGFNVATRTAGSLASTALQLGGGFTIADSLDSAVKLEGAGATIIAGTDQTELVNGKRVKKANALSRKDLVDATRAVSIAEGIDAGDAMAGLGKYKDLTGDVVGAKELLPDVARMATAVGADVSELMENAGNIKAADTEGKMSKDDLLRLLKVQSIQGQKGAVELKDMAKYGSRLVAGASLMGGDRSQAIASSSAMAQIARAGGAASPAEATMAAQRFMTDVQKHGKDIEAAGVKVFDGKGKMRRGDEIVADMIKKSGGKAENLDMFGLGERGIKVLTGAANISNEAGGGAAGVDAVKARFKEFVEAVPQDAQMDEAHRERMDAPDKAIAVSMAKLNEVVGRELVPQVIKLVPELAKAIPYFSQFVHGLAMIAQAFGEHPVRTALMGLGAIMAATITKEIVAAKIGDVIKGLLTSNGGAGNAVANAATASKPTALGRAGAYVGPGLIAATVSYAQAKEGYDAMVEGQTSGEERSKQIADNLGNGGAAGNRAREELAAAKDENGVGGYLRAAANVAALSVNTTKGWLSGGQNDSAEGIKKFFDAKTIVDSDAIRKGVTEAVVQGVKQGVSEGAKANPADPSRNEPMSSKSRGGTN